MRWMVARVIKEERKHRTCVTWTTLGRRGIRMHLPTTPPSRDSLTINEYAINQTLPLQRGSVGCGMPLASRSDLNNIIDIGC